jgi:anaerobic selenocysteine-containing dehydrogenase
VKPFSAARVAARADVSAADIVEAARIFARARRGVVQVGTGPNMARTGNLTEYLALCLMTLTGHWRRVGDPVENPPVLSPDRSFRAAASPPHRAFDLGIDLRVRGFSLAACGLPTSALADEILLPGPGQIKALFVVGGNPLTAWPDPDRARLALESLDLLVVLDPKPTPSARLADFVIAPKLGLEIPDSTLSTESLQAVAPGFGFPLPHAQYAPAVAEPPAGSELIEDWEFFYGLGQRMGLALRVQTALFPIPGVRPVRTALDMERAPSSDELLDLLTADARIPLAVVRAERGPGLFPGDPVRVEATRADEDTARLEVGDATMMAELDGRAEALEADPTAALLAPVDGYRLIPRRMAHAFNSMGTDHPVLRKRYGTNPAFLNPQDLEALGVERGDRLRIASAHGEIEVIAWPDPGLRRGLVSISHAWGGEPEAVDQPMKHGAHVGRLISVEQDFDPYSGIPWMSGFPVSVRAAGAGPEGPARRIAPDDEK